MTMGYPRPPGEKHVAELEAPTLHQLQTLCQLTDAVARAPGLDEIYEAALDGLQGALGARRASILLFDADGVMRFKAWRGLSDGYRRAVEGHTPWSPDARDPGPILVPDVLQDSSLALLRETISAEGIRSLGFIPLVSRERVIGKFMVYFGEPHDFQDEEIRITQTLAAHVAFAVDRRKAEEKLALYREIFANSSEAIAVVNAQGKYLEQNSAHRALIGYEHEELEGRTPAIHLGEAVFREIAAALTERGIYKGDVTSVTKSGDHLDIELSAFTVRDEAGKPVCFVGIKRDLRERKRVEQSLQFLAEASASLDRSLDYDATLNQLAELTVPRLADWSVVDIVGADGRLRPAASTHVNMDSARTLADLLTRRSCAFSLAEQVLVTGESQQLQNGGAFLKSHFGDDSEMALILNELGARSAIAVPLRTHKSTLGVLTLVSAHRNYQERDRTLAEDLAHRGATAIDNARLYRDTQESDRRKEEFLAVLAHELRNPLAPILTSLELLEIDAGDPALLARTRDVMNRQVKNLTRLVDDLLDMSRITRGKIELQKQTVDLGTIVANAVETARPLLERHEVRLTTAIPTEVRFEADPLRIEQVVTNLLSNAAKYTPPGGHVHVSGECDAEWVTLRVRDSGIGIESEMLPRVFEMFMQGSDASRRAGGLGIGLTLARGLVELHGGTVEVKSPGSGRGSEFVLRLPSPCIMAVSESVESIARVGARSTAGRTLIVDDNEDAAIGLADVLRLHGRDVRVAYDGRSAVEEAARFRPDFVLLDLGLPDMDGYEVARRIRSVAGLETIQFIAISGYGQEHFRRRSEELGFAGHLVKPVDWKKLEQMMVA